MDKERLFQYMQARFAEAGFTQAETGVHLSRFRDRYEGMSDEEIETDLRTHGGAAKIVSHVIEYRNSTLMKDPEYRSFVEEEKGSEEIPVNGEHDISSDEDDVKPYVPGQREREDTPAGAGDVSEEKNEDIWFSQLFSHRTEAGPTGTGTPSFMFESETAAYETVKPKAEPTAAEPSGEVWQPEPGSEQRESDLSATRVMPTARKHAVHTSVEKQKKQESREESVEDRGNVSRLAARTYWGEGTEEGFRRFWILFAVSLPFVIALGLVFAALSLGVMALISVLIVALIAALAAEVAAGAAVALVGIIYGISQMFITLPIGMFETGIGITCVGVTMLVGILLYNLAVHFLPFVLKQYIRFLKFMRGFLKDLYYYLKGECYRR